MKCLSRHRALRGFSRALGSGRLPSRTFEHFGGHATLPQCRATFEAWHDVLGKVMHGEVQAEDAMTVLRPHIDPQCVFHPPTYWQSWTGRDETMMLLGTVSEVFGPSFSYGRQWLSDDGREWALEFSATIADSGLTVSGIDLVSLCEQGRIREFTVLARPPNAVAALKVGRRPVDPAGAHVRHAGSGVDVADLCPIIVRSPR